MSLLSISMLSLPTPIKASKSTHPRNPIMSSQSTESRRRRSRPCRFTRPSQRIHSSHTSIRIPSNQTRVLPILYIYSIHPFQDFHCNQARRYIPPGRIGYPIQPTRSNHYSNPIPPTYTFQTMNPGQAARQMADDMMRYGR